MSRSGTKACVPSISCSSDYLFGDGSTFDGQGHHGRGDVADRGRGGHGHILYVDGGSHLGRWELKAAFVMTTNATTAEDRFAKLDIHLPGAPTPLGAYVPAVQTGNLLFLSGMLATSGHTATALGWIHLRYRCLLGIVMPLGPRQ